MQAVASVILSLMLGAPTLAQQVSNQTLNVDGLQRKYILVLPDNFDPAEHLPVVMWAHAGEGTAQIGMELEADFRPLVNTGRFIAVYPEAWPDFEQCLCWGYDLGLGETNGNYEIDLDFIDALIDELVDAHGADRDRMYFGGYSLGGSFTWDVACAMSDKIAAITPVAASMWYSTFDNGCDAALPTAVCHILGTNDFYAPYEGGWVPSAAEQHAFWVQKNQSNPVPDQTNLGGGVTRYTWAEVPDSCHGVQHFRIQNGEHDVPAFTEQSMWAFVSQYALDGVIECVGGCDGDFNGDGTRDVNDILTAIGAFGNGDGGDVDGDGDTDVSDILELLNLFGEDC